MKLHVLVSLGLFRLSLCYSRPISFLNPLSRFLRCFIASFLALARPFGSLWVLGCVGFFFFSWASLSDESLACLRIFFSARKQLSISTPICAIVAIAQTGLLLGICCAGCRLLLPPFGTFSLRLPRLFRRGFLTANIHARLCFVWFFFRTVKLFLSLSFFFFQGRVTDRLQGHTAYK